MQGQNIDTTPIKQEDFASFIRMHLRVTAGAMTKHPGCTGRYVYLDLHAGSGFNEAAGVEGSPVIFARIASSLGIPVEAYFYEKNRAAADALESRLSPFRSEDQCLRVVRGDHMASACALLSSLPRLTFGLIYSDPNGMGTPFDLLAAAADRVPKMDFLASINATARKRARGAFGESVHPLSECLERIPKGHCLIRHPVGGYQWTMAFLSDWLPRQPPAGFWDIKSPEGADILADLTWSQNERPRSSRRPSRPFQSRLAL